MAGENQVGGKKTSRISLVLAVSLFGLLDLTWSSSGEGSDLGYPPPKSASVMGPLLSFPLLEPHLPSLGALRGAEQTCPPCRLATLDQFPYREVSYHLLQVLVTPSRKSINLA